MSGSNSCGQRGDISIEGPESSGEERLVDVASPLRRRVPHERSAEVQRRAARTERNSCHRITPPLLGKCPLLIL